MKPMPRQRGLSLMLALYIPKVTIISIRCGVAQDVCRTFQYPVQRSQLDVAVSTKEVAVKKERGNL